jgi:putative PIN family toxin of toxin-antitoxin system
VDPVELPLLAQLNEEAEIVTPAGLRGGVCRDEDDHVVLATALAGNADVILTGDEDLLVRKNFRGIRIASPRRFLERLDRTS